MTLPPEFITGLFIGGLASFIISYIAFNQALKSQDKHYKYVGPAATVLQKRDWQTIEKNIAHEIVRAKREGIKLGREQIMRAFEESIQKKKSSVDVQRPYFLLGLKVGDEALAPERAATLRLQYEDIKKRTEDSSIHELCDIRIKYVNRAEAILKNAREFQEGVSSN